MATADVLIHNPSMLSLDYYSEAPDYVCKRQQEADMQAHRETYTTGHVLKAAGITNAALQTWIRRGYIIGHAGQGVDMPGDRTRRREFSFFNLMEITIAAALARAGLEPSKAFRAAAYFAHTGDEKRMVALPFPKGRTLLCTTGQHSFEVQWMPGTDWFSTARHYLSRPETMIVVDVSDLFDRAMAAIGLHPQKVLDEAYGYA